MECEIFRERIAADPAAADPECAGHERSCGACAAYAARLRASESLINRALRFDVERLRELRPPAAAPASPARTRRWAVAASVVATGIALWIGARFLPSDDPLVLAEAVETHWSHEPESWVRTSTPVAASALDAALGDDATIDLARLDIVSYARSCLVNGHWVPHLVVQGRSGPVMVLLLAHEQLAETVPLDIPQERLRGVIVPFGDGAIAILGEDSEALDAIERDVSDAVTWSI
jgi:hypothetical protein